jgi:hypothetical protein
MLKKKNNIEAWALIKGDEYKQFLEWKKTKRLHEQTTTDQLKLNKPEFTSPGANLAASQQEGNIVFSRKTNC